MTVRDLIMDLDDTLSSLRRCIRVPGWTLHPDGFQEAREALELLRKAACRALVEEGSQEEGQR